MVSQPARAVWIEIRPRRLAPRFPGSQPARAVWIEILPTNSATRKRLCHSLRGLCGLKYKNRHRRDQPEKSQPARAVWIEMSYGDLSDVNDVSQPARAVWIEIPEIYL